MFCDGGGKEMKMSLLSFFFLILLLKPADGTLNHLAHPPRDVELTSSAPLRTRWER